MRGWRDAALLSLILAKRGRDREDRDAAHKSWSLRICGVAKMAVGYRGCGLPVGDLISEGNVGMIQAVRRFDPDGGVRLSTYAM
jgi:RNA polymerase sigma-32 factor